MRQRTTRAARSKRGAAAAVALFTVAVLVSGCDLARSEDAAAPAPKTPREALIESAPGESVGRYRFTIKDADMTSTGEVDPTAKGLHIASEYKDKDLGFTMRMAFLVVDQESWVKIKFTGTEGLTGLPKLPNKWLRLDKAKITDTESVPLAFDGPDPTNAESLLHAVVSANDKGSGRFDGTVDLTKATGAEVVDADALKALGEAAKAVHFTAAVDASGRLTSIAVDVPAAGKTSAYAYTVTYADYGSGPTVSRPAATEAGDAPAAVYELLNG